jgi:predicted MFS family arabinose efflux permease
MPPLPELETDAATAIAPDTAAAPLPTAAPEGADPPSTEESMPAQGRRPATGFMPVLRNRHFLWLWGGQIFSQLADKLYILLMIYLIVGTYSGESGRDITAWATPIYIANTIPAVLLGSLAGAWADRWPKQKVMVISNLLRGLMLLGLPLLLSSEHALQPVWGVPLGYLCLLVTTLIESSLTQIFAPAEQAAIPLIVKRRYLLAANSLYTATMMAANVVGFAIGEPFLDLADHWFSSIGLPHGEVYFVAGAYLAAAACLVMPRIREAEAHRGDSHVWEDIREGLVFLRENPLVSNAVLRLVLLYSLLAALYVLALSLAADLPGLGAKKFGILLAMAGLGMGLGAFTVGQFGHRLSRRRLTEVGMVGLAAMLASLSLTQGSLGFTLAAIASLGIFASMLGIPAQTTIQEETPEAMRGKVFGLQNNAINIALSLPLALAGVAVSRFGLTPTLISLALLLLGSELLLLVRPRSQA